MLTTPRGPFTYAFPIFAAAALVPDEADACPDYSDYCEVIQAWLDLVPHNAAKIPSDGVLVLRGSWPEPDFDSSLDSVALEVTLDGQPIAGALEPTPSNAVLVWRPAEPWVPGATYQLTGTVTNPPATEQCAPLEFPLAAEIHIDSEPAAPLAPPEFDGVTELSSIPVTRLDSLACCEDAPAPQEDYVGCAGYYTDFDPEQCTPTVALGTFSLVVTGTPGTTGPAADQILYTANQSIRGSLAPELTLTARQTTQCVSFEAVDLATGAAVTSEEKCFGADLEPQLGYLPIDPAETLACPLEQCAVDGVWDETMCTPLGPPADSDTPTSSDSDTIDSTDSASSGGSASSGSTDPGEEGEGACACTTDATTSPALIALGLLALPRRRRAR
jgi:hypothetical protein